MEETKYLKIQFSNDRGTWEQIVPLNRDEYSINQEGVDVALKFWESLPLTLSNSKCSWDDASFAIEEDYGTYKQSPEQRDHFICVYKGEASSYLYYTWDNAVDWGNVIAYVPELEIDGKRNPYLASYTGPMTIKIEQYVDYSEKYKDKIVKGDSVTSILKKVKDYTDKVSKFTPGNGLEMTPDRVLNVILDNKPFVVVDTLPSQPAEGNENKIHIVPTKGATEDGNEFTEYAWVNNEWEKFGEFKADIDLSNYITSKQAAAKYYPLVNGQDLEHLVETLNEGLGHVENDKADKNGTYSELTAGTAQNLLGNLEITDDSAYRPTGGDNDVNSGYAAASIESIKGNARAWNQLAPMITDENYSNYSQFGEQYSTVNVIDGVAKVTINNFEHNYYPCTKYKNNIPITIGHKYIAYADIYSSKAVPEKNFGIEINSGVSFWNKEVPANVWTRVGVIGTAARNYTVMLLRFLVGTDNVGFFDAEHNTYQTKNLMLFDLTLIYGAGNEPTTPEQFEEDYQRWFGRTLDYEEYDEGSIRPVLCSGIKTVGFNLSSITEFEGTIREWGTDRILWKNDCGYKGSLHLQADLISGSNIIHNERSTPLNRIVDRIQSWVGSGNVYLRIFFTNGEWENLVIRIGENADGLTEVKLSNICINFVWSGKRDGEYEPHWEETAPIPITTLASGGKVIFPDGLKRAGNVYDEIKVENGVTKAIKRVGSIDLGTLNFYYQSDQKRFRTNPNTIKDLKYTADVTDINSHAQTLICKYVRNYPYSGNDIDKVACESIGCIFIRDTSFGSDAASFKSAMVGVILYYELATPEEYIIDNFSLPVVYRIDDFGTEQFISPKNGITPIAIAKYGINAVDAIRRLPKRIDDVKDNCLSLDGGEMRNTNIVKNLNAERLGNLRPGLTSGNIPYLIGFPDYNALVNNGFNTQDKINDNESYFKGIIEWLKSTYGQMNDLNLIGTLRPNSSGTGIIHYNASTSIYGTVVINYYTYTFGIVQGDWYYREIPTMVGGNKLHALTSSAFEAISKKDANTLYFVTED